MDKRAVFAVPFRLFNHLEARVRNKHLRNADTLRSLVVFEQSRNDARQSKRRAVERMRELDFLFGIAVAQFQTVGLERLEILY